MAESSNLDAALTDLSGDELKLCIPLAPKKGQGKRASVEDLRREFGLEQER